MTYPFVGRNRIRLDGRGRGVEGLSLELRKILQESDPDVLDEVGRVSRLKDDVRDVREGNTHRLKVYPALRERSSVAYILVDGRYEIARLPRPARARPLGSGEPHQAEPEDPPCRGVQGLPQLQGSRVHRGPGVRDSLFMP